MIPLCAIYKESFCDSELSTVFMVGIFVHVSNARLAVLCIML